MKNFLYYLLKEVVIIVGYFDLEIVGVINVN